MSMKMGEIRAMNEDALKKKLHELEMELVAGQLTKARSLGISIARIKTYISQMKKHLAYEHKRSGKRPIVGKPKIVAEKSLYTGKEQ